MVSHGVTELINHGCHFFDVALGFAGDPEPVSASGLIDDPSRWDDWRRGDPHGRGWVALDNGVNLGIMSEGGRRSYTITGTTGRLVVMQEGERAYLWDTDDESGEFTSAPVELDVPRPDHPWHRGPRGNSRPRGQCEQRREDRMRRGGDAPGHRDRLCDPRVGGPWRRGKFPFLYKNALYE